MPEILTCPSCARKLRVPVEYQGQMVRCPSCNSTFMADAEIATEAPTPPIREAIQPREDLPPGPRRPEHVQAERPFDDIDVPSRGASGPGIGGVPYQDLPAELPGSGKATAVMVMLTLCLVLNVGAALIDLVRLQSAAGGARPAPNQQDDEADLADLFANPVACVQPLAYIPTVVVFCIWIHGAYANLKFFPVTGLQYSAGWAVGYFFVPILNLYRPYQVAQEMWKASDPDVTLNNGGSWRSVSGSSVIGMWWTFWILGNIVTNISARLSLKGDLDPNAEASLLLDIAGNGLETIAGLAAIVMIKQLRDRQVKKFARVVDEQVGTDRPLG